jgi:DNA helicase-2/ATP-dependent DNA helicase PcrA
MKERIAGVVGNRAESVWAGTFHAIFARILRAEASKIGYSANFTVYDTDDTTSLIRTLIKEKNLDPNTYNAATIRTRISLAKSNLLSPTAYRGNAELQQQDLAAQRPYLADVYEAYVQRCRRAGAMDFDDLLFQLYRLFRENPDNVLDKYRKKFRYLHVDEFQDTNFLQYAILRQLVRYDGSAENIFAVGDDAQSIYAFRGATIDNILDFEKDYPRLQTFKLEQNYRSTHHIVSAANEVISNNRRQLNKTIWTDKNESRRIKLLKCLTDDEEARKVADLILEQKHRYHLPNSEIAILYRTNAQSRKFEEQLRRHNLSYKIFGGLSFYQRKEVKDLVAYLRLSVNPHDEEAFRRVINYPARGLSSATVDKLGQLAVERGLSLWDAMLLPELALSDRARKALGAFRKMVDAWSARARQDSAYKLASDIYRQSGLQEALKADTTTEGISRQQNAQSVLDGISEFSDTGLDAAGAIAGDDRTLAAYLQTITLLTDSDTTSDERDYITLMSAHAAKGLEFRSVFVTGMEDNLFPSYMAREEPNGLDEERRLFYVAITRAKEHLTISFAKTRYRFGQIRESKPSGFLSEIQIAHFEAVGGIGAGRNTAATDTYDQPRAAVSGNFTTPTRRNQTPKTAPPPPNFQPAPPDKIVAGSKVLHLKFGEGLVIAIEGPRDGKVATIQFYNDELPERRIVLKFAKLQIL